VRDCTSKRAGSTLTYEQDHAAFMDLSQGCFRNRLKAFDSSHLARAHKAVWLFLWVFVLDAAAQWLNAADALGAMYSFKV